MKALASHIPQLFTDLEFRFDSFCLVIFRIERIKHLLTLARSDMTGCFVITWLCGKLIGFFATEITIVKFDLRVRDCHVSTMQRHMAYAPKGWEIIFFLYGQY